MINKVDAMHQSAKMLLDKYEKTKMAEFIKMTEPGQPELHDELISGGYQIENLVDELLG